MLHERPVQAARSRAGHQKRQGGLRPGQHERFLDAAREHGCEENVGRLDEVVRRVAKLPPQGKEPVKAGKRAK